MSDILDEVLNDAKHEKRLILFRKFFPIAIAFTIIGAIAIAGYSWYKNGQQAQNQQIGDVLVELLSGQVKDSTLVLESFNQLIESKKNKQTELAQIQRVSYLISKGEISEAMLYLENIANNPSYNEITTTYARLLWLSIILDQKELMEADQLKARSYMDYFSKKDQLFFGNATLIKALFYKKINQIETAKEYAQQLIDSDDAPLALKEQAKAIIFSLKHNL